MRWRVRLAAAAGASWLLGLVGACSFVSLDGLSNGPPGGSSADGAADGLAPPLDAASQDDRPLAEGGGSDAAGGDARVDAPTSTRLRRRMTITNGAGTALPPGYSVALTVDLASLVMAGKARPDLADVRVVLDGTNAPRDRVVDSTSNGPLWFSTARTIAAGGSDDGYWLTYADPAATNPPADPSKVFALQDDFSGSMVDTGRWLVNDAPVVSGGTITFRQGHTDGIATPAANDGVPLASAVEIRASLSSITSPADGNTGFYFWLGYQRQGDFTATDPWVVWISRATGTMRAEEKDTASAQCAGECDGPTMNEEGGLHTYLIERAPNGTRFSYDGALKYTISEAPTADYSILVRSYMPSADLVVDRIRARALTAPEPTVALGPEVAY